jgi:hypothetical protein
MTASPPPTLISRAHPRPLVALIEGGGGGGRAPIVNRPFRNCARPGRWMAYLLTPGGCRLVACSHSPPPHPNAVPPLIAGRAREPETVIAAPPPRHGYTLFKRQSNPANARRPLPSASHRSLNLLCCCSSAAPSRATSHAPSRRLRPASPRCAARVAPLAVGELLNLHSSVRLIGALQ